MKLISYFLFLITVTNFVTVTAREQPPSKAEIAAATEYFDKMGFLVLPNFFNKENVQLLQQWKDASERVFTDIFQELYDRGHTAFPQHVRKPQPRKEDYGNVLVAKDGLEYALKEGREEGYKEIVMRNPGRYEIALNRFYSDSSNQVTTEPLLEQIEMIVAPLLRQDNLTNVTVHADLIISTPGAKEQTWHSDGEHVNLEKHEFVHCLNVFIPLEEVTYNRGPTEFFPASHIVTRQPEPMKFNSMPNNTLNQPIAPTLRVGDALLWDYRLLHRGRANIDIVNRPALVFIFHQKWFEDKRNWPKRSIYD